MNNVLVLMDYIVCRGLHSLADVKSKDQRFGCQLPVVKHSKTAGGKTTTHPEVETNNGWRFIDPHRRLCGGDTSLSSKPEESRCNCERDDISAIYPPGGITICGGE